MEEQAPKPEESFQLLEAWRLLKRRRWPFVAVFLLVLAAAAAVHLRTTPQFRGTAQVEIVRQLPRSGTMSDLPSLEMFINQDYYNTQQKVLQSRSLAERTARRLGESLPGEIDVQIVPRSRILTISFEDPDPARAAAVVNAHVAEYIADAAERRVAGIQELRKRLDEESQDLLARLKVAEERLQRYNEANRLTSVDERQNLAVRRLEEASTNLGRTDQEVVQLEGLVDQVQQGDADVERLFQIKPIQDSQVVQSLLLEEARVKQQLAEAAKIYKPRHPSHVAVEERLKDLRSALEREVRKVASGIKAQHQDALARRDKAKEAVEQLKQEKISLDRVIAGAEVLKRDVDATKALYENLVKRVKESDISGAIEVTNISVVDRAVPPKSPSKPNLKLNLAVGLALACLLGGAIAVLADRLDTTVKTPEEIEELTGLPLLGLIPMVDSEPESVSVREPRSPASEGFRAVRTGFLLSPKGGRQVRSIIVLSSGPAEGKTVASMNLATALAQSDRKVLIVDADFHRPRLHKHYKLENDKGLSTALVTEGPIEDFCRPTGIPNLWVLTAGPIPPHPSELLGGPAMKGRLEEAAGKFDKLVLDSPPICAVTDACVMAPMVESHALVVLPGLTARASLRRALSLLKSVGVAPLGLIFNKVPTRGEGYYHYYKYYGYYAGSKTT